MNSEIKQRIKQIKNGEIPDGYRSTKAGVLPKWDCVHLNQIAEPITKKVGNGTYETLSISAGIGFVNQAKKFGKELSGKQYEKYTVLNRGDFSYNKGNSKSYLQGCIYRLKDRETAAVPNVFESFKIKNDSPDYYEQLFTSGYLNKQLSKKINHGVRDNGLLNLTEKDFYSCYVPHPPIAEQQKIAEILMQCDKLIELYQNETDELQKLKKICLCNMFPKNGNDIPKWRFPQFTDAWEQRKLGEISESFEYGLNAAATEYDGKHKYIRITDIDDSTHLFIQDNLTSPDIDFSTADDYLLQAGDVLFARTGASVGKTYIYRSSDGDLYFAGFLIRAKIKRDYDADFVFQNTLTDNYDSYIRITSQRSGQPGVNAQEYANFALSVPCLAEQKKIGAYFTNLDNLITLHQRECFSFDFSGESAKTAQKTISWEQRKVGELTVESSEYTTLEAGFPLLTSSRNGLMYQNEYRGKQTTDSTETMFSIVPLGACTYRHMSDDDVFHLNVNRLEKGLVSREYPVFYASDDNNLDFIVQQINSSAEFRSFCAEQKKGGTRTRLYYKNLCEFQMLIPNTEEQEKIATFLLTLDTLITLHQHKPNKKGHDVLSVMPFKGNQRKPHYLCT